MYGFKKEDLFKEVNLSYDAKELNQQRQQKEMKGKAKAIDRFEVASLVIAEGLWTREELMAHVK